MTGICPALRAVADGVTARTRGRSATGTEAKRPLPRALPPQRHAPASPVCAYRREHEPAKISQTIVLAKP